MLTELGGIQSRCRDCTWSGKDILGGILRPRWPGSECDEDGRVSEEI